MKDRIKNHYLKIGPKNFVIFAVIFLVVTDILNFKFLEIYWVTKNFSLNLVQQTILRSGQVIENFSQITISEMKAFVDNAFYFFLFIIFVNNLFFYFFYLRKKLWAQGFVLFYLATSALLQLTLIFDSHGIHWGWLIYNLGIVPIYLYVFLGVKLLKQETTLPPKNIKTQEQ